MEVILLYDNLSKKTPRKIARPLDNRGNGNKCIFYNQCRLRRINVRYKKISKSLRVDPRHLYLYVIPGLGTLSETLNLISSQTTDIIKKYEIPILLSLPTEGFSFKDFDYWLDRIQHEFHVRNWPNVPKYFLSGNMIIDKVWTDHQKNTDKLISKVSNSYIFEINEHSKFTKTFGCNYYEYYAVSKLKSLDSKELPNLKISDVSSARRSVDFLSYNRHLRSHRFALIVELHRLGLLKNSYYSLMGGENFQIKSGFIYSVLEYISPQAEDYIKNFFQNFKPINIKFENSAVYSYKPIADVRHYLDTFFSLVTETEVTEDSLFITEKTIKPIVNYHPFLIWGSPGTLEFLRSRGYQTFPELFCEDYDKEYDKVKRFNMIVKEVKNFVNLDLDEKRSKFASIVDKLDHNYKNFYSRPDEFKTLVENMFTTIYQDQKSWRPGRDSNP